MITPIAQISQATLVRAGAAAGIEFTVTLALYWDAGVSACVHSHGNYGKILP